MCQVIVVECARSYFKRLLDTMSRYKYIVNAYENMTRWMTHGDEETKKLKRYLHRHLDIPDPLPPALDRDDAKEVMMEFAYQYVSALLTYCSDDLKPGMCVSWMSPTHTRLLTRSHPHSRRI